MARPIGVFACDSFGIARAGIKSILEQVDIRVIGTADTLDECIRNAPHEDVDVYVLGFNPDESPGYAHFQALRDKHEQVGIVAYGSETEFHIITMIYETGANAYIPKSSSPATYVEAVRTVAKGMYYWPPGMAEKIATHFVSGAYRSNPKHVLSSGEMKIFLLLAEGATQMDVAQQLGIGKSSVGNRAVTIRKKLGIERDDFKRVAQEYDLIRR